EAGSSCKTCKYSSQVAFKEPSPFWLDRKAECYFPNPRPCGVAGSRAVLIAVTARSATPKCEYFSSTAWACLASSRRGLVSASRIASATACSSHGTDQPKPSDSTTSLVGPAPEKITGVPHATLARSFVGTAKS